MTSDPDDAMAEELARLLDELPHNTPNSDKARAAITFLTPVIVERCVRICERHGHTDPALIAAIRRGE